MLPFVGVMPLYDDERESYWMLPGYMRMLEECGAVPIMPSLTTDLACLERVADLCGGFVLTGGHDVSPEVYGERAREFCGAVCPQRDAMEAFILDYAVGHDKPVLGICRGAQFINAHFGGTLYQDLPTERAGGVEHHMSPPYARAAHRVTVSDGTLLSEIIGAGEIAVNSYHHQAIKELAPRLEAMAVSEDGVTEAISLPGKKFIMGVQWHPEFSYKSDKNSRKIVNAFVRAIDRR